MVRNSGDSLGCRRLYLLTYLTSSPPRWRGAAPNKSYHVINLSRTTNHKGDK